MAGKVAVNYLVFVSSMALVFSMTSLLRVVGCKEVQRFLTQNTSLQRSSAERFHWNPNDRRITKWYEFPVSSMIID